MIPYELKNPCPFCGGMAKICKINEYELGKTAYYTPECKTENCVGNNIEGYYETPEEAAEAWDRRVSPWRTDPPPKDGTPIIAEFDFGIVAKAHYDFEVWQMAGAPIAFKQDPIRWMEIPK